MLISEINKSRTFPQRIKSHRKNLFQPSSLKQDAEFSGKLRDKSVSQKNNPKQRPNLEFQYLQQKNNKSSNFLVVLFILILIILLIFAGFYCYSFFFQNKFQGSLIKNFENQDSDGDGLTSSEEQKQGTDSNQYDTDFDKIPDGWEVKNKLDPKNYLDATEDFDKDKLNNFQEFQYNSNPNTKDTDNDGFKDGEEVKNGFNPNGKDKLIK